MSSIDLGRKCPATCSEPLKASEPSEVYYPSVFIEGVKGLEDLPDAGTVTFRYKLTRSTVSTDREGDKSTSVNLDLLEIVGTEAEDEKVVDDREDELDKLAKEESEKPTEDEDYD